MLLLEQKVAKKTTEDLRTLPFDFISPPELPSPLAEQVSKLGWLGRGSSALLSRLELFRTVSVEEHHGSTRDGIDVAAQVQSLEDQRR